MYIIQSGKLSVKLNELIIGKLSNSLDCLFAGRRAGMIGDLRLFGGENSLCRGSEEDQAEPAGADSCLRGSEAACPLQVRTKNY